MTMIPEYRLHAEDVRQAMLKTMQSYLSLKTDGYTCTTEMTLSVLLKAAAQGSSIEAVCADLSEVADSNTLREQLNSALDVADLRQQEMELNLALSSVIPPDMPGGGLEVAIDLHDEPFYGQSPELRSYTCKAQAKQGTSRFFRIASAYVIWREVRLTLALTYVLPEDDLSQVVERLLQRLEHLGLHATVLYVDKGFCSGAVIRLLRQRHQAAIIACPIRGKQGGTRALCRGSRSYRTLYTFADHTTVDIFAVATLVPDKSGHKRRKWLLFVVLDLDWTPQQVYQKYRRRFGVECSYRLLRQSRARTTSLNPALRFFLLGLALLMQNVWVKVRWLLTRRPSKGRHPMIPSLLRFDRFRRFLIRAVEALYQVVMTIPVYHLPQSVIY
jgi:DDE family transposase